MNDTLIYRLADTFNTDLFQVGNNIRGLVPAHEFKIAGAWTLKSDLTIIADEVNTDLVSAMVRIVGDLWVYFIATEDDSWLLFFDGSRAKIHVGTEREFGLGSAKGTVKKLKPSVTRIFRKVLLPLNSKGTPNPWEPTDLSNLSFI